MEHVLSQPRSPWRTAALVASGVAAVELVLLIALGLPLLGRQVAGALEASVTEAPVARAPAPAPGRKGDTPAATLGRSDTSILVLNGNGVGGAAGAAGARLRGLGYIVAGVGNAPRSDYARTIVMYRPGREAEARRLARELGVRVVAPLDGLTVDQLMGAQLAVVLGAR